MTIRFLLVPLSRLPPALEMSKRLNKRQQREQEELEQLRATQKQIEPSEQVQAEEEDEADLEETKVDVQEAGAAEPVNAFAAVS